MNDRLPEKLHCVLELLERVAEKTGMYVQPVEVGTVQSYLNGLQAGCSLSGLVVSRELYKQAAASRGWTVRAEGVVWQMRANNMDDASLIQELISIQAEAFRLAGAIQVRPPARLTDDRRAELERRNAELDSKPEIAMTWDQVRASVERKQ